MMYFLRQLLRLVPGYTRRKIVAELSNVYHVDAIYVRRTSEGLVIYLTCWSTSEHLYDELVGAEDELDEAMPWLDLMILVREHQGRGPKAVVPGDAKELWRDKSKFGPF